jgi:hypothetical protein
MAKKPHPADQAEIDKIAAATHFAVHLRAGPFDKITKDAATLEDAIRIADAMGTTPDGRRAMVYAITPEGRAALVPATRIEQARRST